MKGYRKLVKGEYVQAGDIFRNKVMYRPLKAVERRSKSPNKQRVPCMGCGGYKDVQPVDLCVRCRELATC